MFAAGHRVITRVCWKAHSVLLVPTVSYVLSLRTGGKYLQIIRPTSAFPALCKEYRIPLAPSKKIRVDTACDLVLKPVDPESTNQDQISVRALGPETCNFNIESAEAGDLVSIIGRFEPKAASEEKKTPLEIQVPFHRDVEVSNEQGNVSIQNIKSPTMSIKVKNGSIKCKNVCCESVIFECLNGSVHCEGVVQGNVYIKVRDNGDVKALNFQGGLLKVETDHGDIYVASTYCDDSTFLAAEGNLFLKNIHQNNHVSVKKGNITIAGLDGTLDAQVQEGNIQVQVTQLSGNSHIEVQKGNVILSLEKEDVCRFDLFGRTITLKDNLQSLGTINECGTSKVFRSNGGCSQQPVLKVVCNEGDVCLEKKSWIQSMLHGMVELKKPKKTERYG